MNYLCRDPSHSYDVSRPHDVDVAILRGPFNLLFFLCEQYIQIYATQRTEALVFKLHLSLSP